MQAAVKAQKTEGDPIQAFAGQEVLPSLEDRYRSRAFPRDLWRKMAGQGLFRMMLPEAEGGLGEKPEELVRAVEGFVAGGRDLGLCLSWLVHLLIHTRAIALFGTEAQRGRYLPRLVSGEWVGALAASEPETGADPRRMRSRAMEENGAFRLSGRKTFVTNGPVADLVIVLAPLGAHRGPETVTAFLVEASTPGFSRKPMDLGYLNTSPHGEILLEDCRLPAEAMLGRPGDGHARISRAVFGWERYLVTVGMAAAFRSLLDRAARWLAQEPDLGAGGQEDAGSREIARLHVALEAFREMAWGLAAEVLSRTELNRRLLERLLFLGEGLSDWWDRFSSLANRCGLPKDFPVGILMNDARILSVNQRLRSFQLDRIALSILENARRGPDSPQSAHEA